MNDQHFNPNLKAETEPETPETETPAAEPVAPPKRMTLKEWKQIMRLYFTVRRDQVKACGHKLDIVSGPRTNCEYCWFAYFNNNASMVQTADECFQKEGKQTLVAIRGTKFVKMFLRFMGTIARLRAEAAELQAKAAEQGVIMERVDEVPSPEGETSG